MEMKRSCIKWQQANLVGEQQFQREEPEIGTEERSKNIIMFGGFLSEKKYVWWINWFFTAARIMILLPPLKPES
jgi:hypothetical protein